MISIVILFAAGIAAAFFLRQTAANRKRRVQLEMARELLAEHREAIAQFVDDPRSPPYLRRALLDLSESLEIGDVVIQLPDIIKRRQKPRSHTSKLATELDCLERDHPDLAQTYVKAISTGVTAALLACDRTATQEGGLPVIFANPADVQEVSRVVRDEARGGQGEAGFRPAHAS